MRCPRLYWGWVVCLCFLLLFTMAAGIAFSYSEIMIPLNKEVHSSVTMLSWIGSMPVCLPMLASPVGTWLHFRFGCQRTVVAGVMVTTLGLAFTAMVSSVALIAVLYGVVVGLGLMMVVNPPFFLLEEYFPYHHPRHVLATSIIACAFPLATLIFNPLTYYLLTVLQWRVTYSCFAVTMFLVGLGTTITFTSQRNNDDQITFIEATEEDIAEREKYEAMGKNVDGVVIQKRTKIIMGALWLLASVLKAMGYYTPFVTLVKQMDVLGIPQSKSSTAMAVIGTCEVFSRLITSYVGDYFKGRILYVYVGCTAALCLQNALGSLADEFDHLVAYAAGLGLFGGPIIAAMYSSCSEVLSGQHVPAMFSVFRVGLGLGSLLGPTIAGAIFDTTSSFHIVFYLNAVIYLATSVFYLSIILLNKYKPRLVFPARDEEIPLAQSSNKIEDHKTFSSETTTTFSDDLRTTNSRTSENVASKDPIFEVDSVSVSDSD